MTAQAPPAPDLAWARRRSRVRGVQLPSVLTAGSYLVAFVVLTTIFYVAARRTNGGDSDVATIVLQGQSVNSGHLLLNGWRMGVDSFWTIEVPFYAIGVAILGVNSHLLFLVPAMFAAAVVLVAFGMVRRGLTGTGRIVAPIVTLTLLALPSGAWGWIFLRGGWHIGTTLWCLIAFWCVRRGQWGAGVVVAAVFLAAGLLGDLQTVPLGVVPVLAAGVVGALRSRSIRAALPALAAGVGGAVLYGVVHWIVPRVGGLKLAEVNPSATGKQRIENAHNLPSWLAQAFGSGNGHLGTQGVPTALASVRYIGCGLVILAMLVATIFLLRGVIRGDGRDADSEAPWRLDDLLLFGCAGDIGFFVLATLTDDPGYLRYLTATVIYGAILAGRLAGRWAPAIRGVAVRRVIAGLGVVIVGLYGAGFLASTTRDKPQSAVPMLVNFLEAHNLHLGVGNYWASAITTVYSGDKVQVRPVQAGGGKLIRYRKQSTKDWYAGKHFQFVVYETTRDTLGVNDTNAVRSFGPYAHKYALGPYRVLVFAHPFTMSSA